MYPSWGNIHEQCPGPCRNSPRMRQIPGHSRIHICHCRPGRLVVVTPHSPAPTWARRKPPRFAACRRTHDGRRDPPDRLPTDSRFRYRALSPHAPVARGQPQSVATLTPSLPSVVPLNSAGRHLSRSNASGTRPLVVALFILCTGGDVRRWIGVRRDLSPADGHRATVFIPRRQVSHRQHDGLATGENKLQKTSKR